ncbi:hypothetical protein PHMEG_00024559 [Phytophthora megakarya]|uniref:Transposase n=1 Tax=Phytophthora megakarya TaxID=4795 RepID=A0A225VE70_9STRA|nr:hypothetical protein PHMEG_00024559 [Phytophthora megakarya]
MDSRPASLYRAISLFTTTNKTADDYTLLPSYLDAFSKKNSESHQIAFLPVLQIDGTHMKNNNYNGVCLTLVELDGNHQVIPMAVGGSKVN